MAWTHACQPSDASADAVSQLSFVLPILSRDLPHCHVSLSRLSLDPDDERGLINQAKSHNAPSVSFSSFFHDCRVLFLFLRKRASSSSSSSMLMLTGTRGETAGKGDGPPAGDDAFGTRGRGFGLGRGRVDIAVRN